MSYAKQIQLIIWSIFQAIPNVNENYLSSHRTERKWTTIRYRAGIETLIEREREQKNMNE